MPEFKQGHVVRRGASRGSTAGKRPVPSWDEIQFGTKSGEKTDPVEDRAAAEACSCTCHEAAQHPPASEVEQRLMVALDALERVDFARMSDTMDRMNAQLDRWEKREEAAVSTTAYLRVQLQALASTLGSTEPGTAEA
ncbi:hypothetical protein AB2L28_20525 [Kineococcus sp. TBRC 1896]|uniref:Uncharacterized protein n=1 Tax=Kineococcus mangrovi TaxID=1660183 RepID=A0ABV4I7I6_9ACTN